MKVTVTVTRVYEMDATKVLSEPTFAPPAADVPNFEKERWLRESFYELCGFDRDEDHVDGTYVKLVDESSETEFETASAS